MRGPWVRSAGVLRTACITKNSWPSKLCLPDREASWWSPSPFSAHCWALGLEEAYLRQGRVDSENSNSIAWHEFSLVPINSPDSRFFFFLILYLHHTNIPYISKTRTWSERCTRTRWVQAGWKAVNPVLPVLKDPVSGHMSGQGSWKLWAQLLLPPGEGLMHSPPLPPHHRPFPPCQGSCLVAWGRKEDRWQKKAKEAQEGRKTGECDGRRPRLAWEWSSSVPEPGLLLKHTNTLQQVLRQTHYSSAQYVFPCRKEPLLASSSWDVGCRTQSNGPALLRPLTLMPVRRRHQRPKIASASPTSHPGPCAFQGLPLQVDFIRGGERISGRRLFVVCFYSKRPFPSKEGNLKTLIFSETFSKERFVSSTKSEHLIQNQFSQRLGPVSGANSDRQSYYGRATREMDPLADWRVESPESSSFRSSKSQVHWTRWPWFQEKGLPKWQPLCLSRAYRQWTYHRI